MADAARSGGCYRFDRFSLEIETGELRRGEDAVPLRSQAAQILALLLRERGRLVTREQIRSEVWGSTNVDFDQGLNDCIRGIRAVLGDDAREPRFIETLPRRGYRFIGEADWTAAGSPARERSGASRSLRVAAALGASALLGLLVASAARSDPPPAEQGRVRIAVMPFQEISDDDTTYFVDGLTEELIASLGSLHPERLGVIARTTTREYARRNHDVASLARALDVDFVLEGSVRRQGQHARITAELVAARTQTQVWVAAWDGDLRDILELQARVARVVARAVRVNVRPDIEARIMRGRPVNPEAHRFYLQARSLWHRMDIDSLRRSINVYEQALRIQPDHALAWAGLAETFVMLGDYTAMAPAEVVRRSQDALAHAMRIDPDLAAVWVAQGVVEGLYEQRWEEAERSFLKAIELNPAYPSAHTWYAQLLRARGRFDEAVAQARMAVDQDPLSAMNGVNLGFALYTRGDVQEARRHFAGVLEMEPEFPPALLGLGLTQLAMGQTEESIIALERAAGAVGGSALFDSNLAYTCAISGCQERARQILAQMEQAQPRSPFLIALVHVALGDDERALSWLETAFDEADPRARAINVDPRFEPLREDPRFADLVRRFGLAPSGEAAAGPY